MRMLLRRNTKSSPEPKGAYPVRTAVEWSAGGDMDRVVGMLGELVEKLNDKGLLSNEDVLDLLGRAYWKEEK